MCHLCGLDSLKTDYKKLSAYASQAYQNGSFKDATYYYNRAFYSARLLFKLAEVPTEAVNYLVDACANCTNFCKNFCKSSCPHKDASTVYLDATVKELQSVIVTQNHANELRCNALCAFLQVSNCLLHRLQEKRCTSEVIAMTHNLEQIWRHHCVDLVTLH